MGFPGVPKGRGHGQGFKSPRPARLPCHPRRDRASQPVGCLPFCLALSSSLASFTLGVVLPMFRAVGTVFLSAGGMEGPSSGARGPAWGPGFPCVWGGRPAWLARSAMHGKFHGERASWWFVTAFHAASLGFCRSQGGEENLGPRSLQGCAHTSFSHGWRCVRCWKSGVACEGAAV